MRSSIRWKYLARSPKLAWDILFRGRYDYTFDLMPMHQANMPLRKRLNLLRSGLNLLYRRLKPWSWPIQMQVELTNFCNLRCPVCPTGLGKIERPAQVLDPVLFERLMDEVGPYLLGVCLWAWGEPLLHPDFGRMVRITRRHGILSSLSTNGQNLDDPKVQDQLLADPPTYLIVAIDGITEETHATYRVGASLKKALAGVRQLAAMKRQRGQEFPILHMRYIAMKHNQHEAPQLKAFAQDNGFDMLTIRSLSIIDDDENQGRHHELVPDAPQFQPYQYEEGRRVHRNDYLCQLAFTFPTMLVDGTLVACDQDFNGKYAYGRLDAGTTVADLWHGPRAMEMRKVIRTSREQYSFCRNCPYADRPRNTCSMEVAMFRPPPAATP
jgi:radical SAM protein with 4Fe4S-binding SPASM domain